MGLFFGILVLATLSAAAVFSIIINRRENKDRYATQKNTASPNRGDFTKTFICVYALLIVATGFILTKVGLFCC